ncbi:MAG: hypothetical protein KA218_06920 [Arenimonas sp.]|nr:hypothetical protein [Arenimonas sp.]MBP7981512.1 hypothetical protein [Arenimonas sp.]
MSILPALLWAALGAASGASAAQISAAAPDKYEQRRAFVTQFAGDAKSSMPFFRSYDFEPLGEDALLLWESPGRAYLLDVEDFCADLPTARAITINSKGATVSAGFDAITVLDRGQNANNRCRILKIRPVDVKAMKAAEKARRELEKNAENSS